MTTIQLTDQDRRRLADLGVELGRSITRVSERCAFEAPCVVAGQIGPSFEIAVGAFSYTQGGLFSRVRIGRYCSIAPEVSMGAASHPTAWLSTSPFQYRKDWRGWGTLAENVYGEADASWNPRSFSTVPRSTNIGDDVWIGQRAVVLPGVNVGSGAVIGAHSVVTRDVPPFSVVAGAPARVIRYRFPEQTIERLIKSDWCSYAPWHMKNIKFDDINQALDQIEDLHGSGTPKWNPGWKTVTDLDNPLDEAAVISGSQ
ncbi:MAG: CatB-related O-acetyltransferase [Alphaproteobacteria bacterium]|nr:MAG: CatB-related O-acetyltransferase [Alphaproteobacteria bacterium]